MLLINKPNGNYTARQLKLPLEIEKLINISDPVYTFCEVMNHGFCSLREIEKLCRTDIRYMYLLDEMKADSIMVGDRKDDIYGAHNADIEAVGVRFGYAADGELEEAGADYIVNTVFELTALLLMDDDSVLCD